MKAKASIFVVDDDDDLRDSICEELHRQGYKTEGAKHGERALSVLRKGPAKPDLVLLDLLMPETDGWEVVAALKGDPQLRQVPIVLMSAVPPKSTSLQAQGVAASLPKPFTMEELLFVVSRVLPPLPQ
jgi:two-component system chemotaxis response regulator CheY